MTKLKENNHDLDHTLVICENEDTRESGLSSLLPLFVGGSDSRFRDVLELLLTRQAVEALAEMYVQGVSTRKVAAITEQLCGYSVKSTQVSRAAAELDTILEAWRNRPLGVMPYLVLDARYEKVRQNGIVQDAAVLIAIGIGLDGKRQVIGVSVALSEQEDFTGSGPDGNVLLAYYTRTSLDVG